MFSLSIHEEEANAVIDEPSHRKHYAMTYE